MNTGKLNRFITIQTLVQTEVSGHVTEAWSLAETVRASVTQFDGSRLLDGDELKDKVVYKIIVWDNSYSDNLKIGYLGLDLFPVKPIEKNPGKSFLNEVIIYASAKQSNILTT